MKIQFNDFFQRLTRVTEISSQKELALVLGVAPAAITQAKTRGVPRAWPLLLADLLGLNPEWIRSGAGPVYQPGNAKTVFVPKVAAQACAGAGSFLADGNIIGELPFERQWITRQGVPTQMVAMEVTGESMSPELEHGDNILVDQSQTEITANAIYVVALCEELLVKRVQIRPGLVILMSTNQKYHPISLQGDELDTFRVIGRVLWSSRSHV